MKKWTAFILALCLLSPTLSVWAAEAPDWAAGAYKTLEERQVLSDPRVSGRITRGDFVTLLVELLKASVPQEELAAYPAKEAGYFADTSGAALLQAAAYGILEGTRDGETRYAKAGDALTREQAAKMVCSLLDFLSHRLGRTVEPAAQPASYADEAAISLWARPFTGTIASYGLMKGDNESRFNPGAELDWPSAVVLGERTLLLMDGAEKQGYTVLELQSQVNWSGAARFGANDYSVSRPKTGWVQGYDTIDNGDGTVSGLVVGAEDITVERFAADGTLAGTKTLAKELPTFGTFFDSGEHFYLAFGQSNPDQNDSQEVFRVVQYDREWNRLGSVSVNGKDSYTDEPFRSTVSRMAVSGDGKTVTLHAARKRYDGHQSNITILMNTKPFGIQSVMGRPFPSNHVSHSFGQFIQYDGDTMITVDHGDAYPRSFVLQGWRGSVDLLKLYGDTGENVTNAIGSGLAVSDSGYLFLGCSDPQDGSQGKPWNVFLAYMDKNSGSVSLTWLTRSETTINTARLVKLDGDNFLALWKDGEDVHCQKLDGKGALVGEEQVLRGLTMPPADPVVMDGDVCWVQASDSQQPGGKPCLYRIDL